MALSINKVVVREYQRIDNRRKREYEAKLAVIVQVAGAEWGGPQLHHLEKALRAKFSEREPCVDVGSCYSSEESSSAWVHFRFPVPKPSEIPTEDECLEILGDVEARVALAVERANDSLERERVVKAQTRLANATASVIAKEAAEKAKAVCRFNQRLAALVAEYQAELEVQLEVAIAEALITGSNGSGEDFDLSPGEAHQAHHCGIKVAEHYLTGYKNPVGLGSGTPNRLRAEELGLEA